jgi:hypothetical protein
MVGWDLLGRYEVLLHTSGKILDQIDTDTSHDELCLHATSTATASQCSQYFGDCASG